MLLQPFTFTSLDRDFYTAPTEMIVFLVGGTVTVLQVHWGHPVSIEQVRSECDGCRKRCFCTVRSQSYSYHLHTYFADCMVIYIKLLYLSFNVRP